VNPKWQELVEVEQVLIGDHWNVQDECKLICGWCVQVRNSDLKKVQCKLDKWDQVLLLDHMYDMLDDSVQDVMGKCPWS